MTSTNHLWIYITLAIHQDVQCLSAEKSDILITSFTMLADNYILSVR